MLSRLLMLAFSSALFSCAHEPAARAPATKPSSLASPSSPTVHSVNCRIVEARTGDPVALANVEVHPTEFWIAKKVLVLSRRRSFLGEVRTARAYPDGTFSLDVPKAGAYEIDVWFGAHVVGRRVVYVDGPTRCEVVVTIPKDHKYIF